jgi:hypothetical protein
MFKIFDSSHRSKMVGRICFGFFFFRWECQRHQRFLDRLVIANMFTPPFSHINNIQSHDDKAYSIEPA